MMLLRLQMRIMCRSSRFRRLRSFGLSLALVAGSPTCAFVEIASAEPEVEVEVPALEELDAMDGTGSEAAPSGALDVEAEVPSLVSTSTVFDLVAPSSAGLKALPPEDDASSREEGSPEEIRVIGRQQRRPELESSAEQVDVVDYGEAQAQAADVSEVLARQPGVTLQRSGGLGSATRICLNGLCDGQLAFFVDGVPFEAAGFASSGGFGLQLIPVTLVESIELHRGVVPIRLGADALGGALDVKTVQPYGTGLSASYQVGSFGSHQIEVTGRHHDDATGLFVSAEARYAEAANDYEVDVQAVNERGTPYDVTVPRFHDGLQTYGGFVEAGVVGQPWAERLSLKAFAASYAKELQHNPVMTVPYGEVESSEMTVGGVLRYEVELFDDLHLSSFASYARREIGFVDDALSVYDWFGEVVNTRAPANAGEIEDATDRRFGQDLLTGRVVLTWTLDPILGARQRLTVASSPYYGTRVGEERLRDDAAPRDPLAADRRLFRLVTGLEHALDAFPVFDASGREDFVLENILFFKSYFYSASTEEVVAGGSFQRRDLETHDFGLGDGLRLRAADWLSFKVGYEYAARLPSVDEVFGDGALVIANLELTPERSHNFNITGQLDSGEGELGEVSVDLNGFWRESENLIVLLAGNDYSQYQNVNTARTLGVEGATRYSVPGRWLRLDGAVSYADIRNLSSEGTFGRYEGDRVPQRPYFTASWGARGRVTGLPGKSDSLEPYYIGRFVHEFYRGWESAGSTQYKQAVDVQVTHTTGVSYRFGTELISATVTLEVSNLTDEKVYDFFGVQRPGRAFSLKLMGEL